MVQIRPSTYIGDQLNWNFHNNNNFPKLQEPCNSESILAPQSIEFREAPNGPMGWPTENALCLFAVTGKEKEIVTYPSYLGIWICFVSTIPPKLTYPMKQVNAFSMQSSARRSLMCRIKCRSVHYQQGKCFCILKDEIDLDIQNKNI